ncbi:MAG: hypothetical protein ACJ8FU_04385 [Xanthobacteraceae bacterium]|jgi:hypothetical protein
MATCGPKAIGQAKTFNMPIVLSAVGVEMGVNEPTRASILTELPRVQRSIGRP